MRLSWNEVRARAAAFAAEWADAYYENGETQSFYNHFFYVFGVKRRSVSVYEQRVQRLSGNTGFIDLFWPQVLLVEQKSAGRDLNAARVQAEDYYLALKENERPRYILACDFQTFELYDLSERTKISFKLEDLPDHVERFGFIMGVQKVAFKDQDPVNIEAAELVGQLHDQLEAGGDIEGEDLEKFLVRIVFCLFADDTGVFQPRNLFLSWLEDRTSEDGADLGAKLAELFQTLDTPEDRRGKHLDEDLAAFPYINGDLFKGATRIPSFDASMRDALIAASRFDWSPISPAIFGSLFQSVMEPAERRAQGAHYTTEKNIMKVIGPLFLERLWADFEKALALKRGRKKALEDLHQKLAELQFFDPACGCGNFLIISYRELRRLEIAILKAADEGKESGERKRYLDINDVSKVDVDQFHGIEIGEFPAEIARAAMWMMDHIMNVELSLAFGENYARIPLVKSANIVHGDALEIDWTDVIPPEHCSYVLGNPPFIGAKMQSAEQRQQVRKLAQLGGSGGTLDYVGAWFLKAGDYVNRIECGIGIAFVATNSITQGEQVAQLWPLLFERYRLEIAFAHRTFAWGSDARGRAHVHVVIIGLTMCADEPDEKRLFSYQDTNGEPEETRHKALSPYLIDASTLLNRHTIIDETPNQADRPRVVAGSQPIDFGQFVMSSEDRAALLAAEPNAADLIVPYFGAHEFLNGGEKWVLTPFRASPSRIRQLPIVLERISAVRKKRAESKRKSTQAAADRPAEFGTTVVPDRDFLVIPKVSSERRLYAPVGYARPPAIPSDLVYVALDASKADFSILQSTMHMAWLRTVGGRLKSDYRYSIGMVYNTFPWPALDEKSKAKLTDAGQGILDARANHSNATLADLYDPDTMPSDLRKAHRVNDLAVDRLYRKRPFESERERVEYLFQLYDELRAPL
nr:DNA methyltransferase [uncultured Hyphomonas sp.]